MIQCESELCTFIISMQRNTLTATPRKRNTISVLFSEGSSLSARQAISALEPLGYTIDLCDPNPLCLGRFSRFVRQFYRCPPSGIDPKGYLQFISNRLEQGRYDVLFPVHEQAFLFARLQHRLAAKTGLALTEFDHFALLQSKSTFAQLLTQLDLPQPPTRIICSSPELEMLSDFPYYIKKPYSTAGRGVWRVENAGERSAVIRVLEESGFFDGQAEIVVQNVAPGILCQAQSVFERGRLIAAHCTSQQAVGMGGSQSARMGVDHPIVRTHLAVLGQHLSWHGAMVLDYLYEPASGRPFYIEANPRLVEPMNAALSGINLADILVRLSLGESFENERVGLGHFGFRSHSLMAMLLGLAEQGESRVSLVKTMVEVFAKHGAFVGSEEDLTPATIDPFSLIPLAIVSLQLLINPAYAQHIAGQAVSGYSLTPSAIEIIRCFEDIKEHQ
ncbi:MAG: ATP-grasp domain-containing protein [Bacilli bacterium]